MFDDLIVDFDAFTGELIEGGVFEGVLGPGTTDDSWTITVAGTLIGRVDMDPLFGEGVSHDVQVTETGSVSWMSGEDQAVFLGTGDTLTNAGRIEAPLGTSVVIQGDGVDVLNSGDITSLGSAIETRSRQNDISIHNTGTMNTSLTTVRLSGDRWEIVNEGSILASIESEFFLGWAIAAGGDDGVLRNSGEISGSFIAVNLNGDNNSIFNTGSIVLSGSVFDNAVAVVMQGTVGNHFQNDGLVQSDVIAVDMHGQDARLINNGSIVRTSEGVAVQIDGQDTLFRNRGAVDGDIEFLQGDDRYAGFLGTVDGQISMGSGADTAIGGAAGETILGGDGADVIRGRRGDDTLLGNSGRDTIRGDGGADLINGGKGDDTLTGGRGADVFQFGNLADDDVITDFQVGTDLLDLTIPGVTEEVEALAAMTDTADGALLDLSAFGAQGSVLLAGVSIADLDDPFLV